MNKRVSFGRRKSDWLIPLGFLAVGVIAAFWASYNRTKKSDIERQNEALRVQVKNLERIVHQYEKRDSKVNKPTGPGTKDTPMLPKGTMRPPGNSKVSLAQPNTDSATAKRSAAST
jgi:hypothetical protein